MSILDLVIALFVLLLVARGAQTGFLAGALSLAGVVVGAAFGSRVAPLILADNEDPLLRAGITLASILAFAVLGDVIARSIGRSVRRRFRSSAPAVLDSLGGAVLGLALSLTLVWIAGTLVFQAPPLAGLQPSVERSRILATLDERMPSGLFAEAVSRLDPLPEIRGPSAEVPEPDGTITADPDVQAATTSTVRVTGIACGYGVGGSGWVAAPNLVVTNAHVVAGEDITRVQPGGTGRRLPARVVVFDPSNDVAVLRVPKLDASALPLAEPEPTQEVAVIGFPENGPLNVQPGRTGPTRRVISTDAYNEGPVERTVTSFNVFVRPGNSGGPAVNERGEVVATIFASRADTRDAGYGIPSQLVGDLVDLAKTRSAPTSTGECAA